MIERIYRWLLEEGLEEFSDIIDDLELIITPSGVPVKVRVASWRSTGVKAGSIAYTTSGGT